MFRDVNALVGGDSMSDMALRCSRCERSDNGVSGTHVSLIMTETIDHDAFALCNRCVKELIEDQRFEYRGERCCICGGTHGIIRVDEVWIHPDEECVHGLRVKTLNAAGLPTGAWIGILIGVLAVLALVAFATFSGL